MAFQAGFYVDYSPEGEPYLGFSYEGPGIALSIMVADRITARETQSGFDKAINELMRMKPRSKLVAVEGSIDGIRAT